MKCQEFEDRLQLLLDERKLPERDELLVAHAQGCSACREDLHAQEALFEALPRTRMQPSAAWSKTVGEKVIAATLVEKSSAKEARVPRWRVDMRWVSVALVGVAAAVALMFSPAWKLMTEPAVKPDGGEVVTKEPEHKGPNGLAVTLPGRREHGPQKVVTPAPVPMPSPAPAQESSSLNEYQLALQHWMQTIPDSVDVNQIEDSPGIRPLASSIGLAIDTLRRTLPGHHEGMRVQAPPSGAWMLPEFLGIS